MMIFMQKDCIVAVHKTREEVLAKQKMYLQLDVVFYVQGTVEALPHLRVWRWVSPPSK